MQIASYFKDLLCKKAFFLKKYHTKTATVSLPSTYVYNFFFNNITSSLFRKIMKTEKAEK